MSDFLPYGRQSIDAEDIAAVTAALQDTYLTCGPQVDAYEADFCAGVGAAHAVSCNSGTAALHLALAACGLTAGQAVIVPSLTFLATANAVRYCGAEVVFADVDPQTGLLTPQTLADAVKRTSLPVQFALPVHLNGRVCDMAALSEVARSHGMELIEDACHALGASTVGECGFSRAVCFSTHPVKTIATGEGGMVTTCDPGVADRMRLLRSHGMIRAQFHNPDLAYDAGQANPWYYEMQEMGWNYRLPDILCALGRSQLRKLSGFLDRRRQLASLYDRLLEPLSPVIQPAPHPEPHGFHLYVVRMDFTAIGLSRCAVMEHLKSRGIGTQVHYLPVHHQPYYRQRYGELHLPGADAYYSRCLSLPLFPQMREEDVERVVAALMSLTVKA